MTRPIAAGHRTVLHVSSKCLYTRTLTRAYTCAHKDILIQKPVSKKSWNAAWYVNNNKMISIIKKKKNLRLSILLLIANHDYKNVPCFKFSPTVVETGLQLNCTNTVWWALNAVASFHRSRIRFSYLLTKNWSDLGSIVEDHIFSHGLDDGGQLIDVGWWQWGCVRRGEVAWMWPTAPPPSSLYQQSCVATLNPPPQHLTFYRSQISNDWEI